MNEREFDSIPNASDRSMWAEPNRRSIKANVLTLHLIASLRICISQLESFPKGLIKFGARKIRLLLSAWLGSDPKATRPQNSHLESLGFHWCSYNVSLLALTELGNCCNPLGIIRVANLVHLDSFGSLER